MTWKYLSRLLILVLGLALAKPAHGQQCLPCGPIGGSPAVAVTALVLTAVAVVIVTAVVIHESTKKRAISGCVNSGANGMTLTNEKDMQIYALSGDTTGVKAGDRMKVRGKRVKTKGPNKALAWKVTQVTKDFGVCQP